MIDRRLKVFLAHSSRDKDHVREFFYMLAADGFEPWLDENSLLPGQDWQLEIKKAVKGSDVVAVFLSKNSVEHQGYINKEILYSLDIAESKPEGSIFIVPIQLDDCTIPERLNHLHCLRPILDMDFSAGSTYISLQLTLLHHSYHLGLLNDDEYYFRGLNLVPRGKALPGWDPSYEMRGDYLVRGQNPNGSRYYGTASLIQSGNSIKMRTIVGAHSFSLEGQIKKTQDSYVLVFEGKNYTVTYSLKSQGWLDGKWGENGVEELIPASPFADIPGIT